MLNFQGRKTIAEEIADFLRRNIACYTIKPGEKISEAQLIKTLGVSRSPIREAVRTLEGEGLLERVPRKGVYAKKMNLKKIQEIFSIRSALEGIAAREAAAAFTATDKKNLRTLVFSMQQAVRNHDAVNYLNLNTQFHRKFIQKSGNVTLADAVQQIEKPINWYLLTALSCTHACAESLSEHEDILNAFCAGSAGEVEAKVIRHIQRGSLRVKRLFQKNRLKEA